MKDSMWIDFGLLMLVVIGIYEFIFSFVTIMPPGC